MHIYIYAVLPPTIAKLVIISSILVNYGLFIGTTNQIRSGGAPPLVTDHYLDLLSGSSLGIFPVLNPLIGESTGNVFTFSDTIWRKSQWYVDLMVDLGVFGIWTTSGLAGCAFAQCPDSRWLELSRKREWGCELKLTIMKWLTDWAWTYGKFLVWYLKF